MHFLHPLLLTALLGVVAANSVVTYSEVGGAFQPAYVQNVAGAYGFAVVASKSGKEVITSAPLFQTGVVSVLNFNGKALVEKQLLTPPATPTAVSFGNALALGGKYLVVADNSATVGAATDAGAVHMYKKSGLKWSFMQTLTLANAATNDFFGTSVALSKDGKLLAATALGVLGPNGEIGSTFIYRRSGNGKTAKYTLIQTVTPPVGVFGGPTGNAVTLSGNGQFLAISGKVTAISSFNTIWLYTWDKAQAKYVPLSGSPTLQGASTANLSPLVLSPNGQDLAACTSANTLLIASYDKAAKAFKVTQTITPPGATTVCTAVAFSADSKSMVVGQSGAGVGEGQLSVLKKNSRTGWTVVAGPITQRAPATTGATMGAAVAISNKYIFAGAPEFPGYAAEGALFAFKKA